MLFRVALLVPSFVLNRHSSRRKVSLRRPALNDEECVVPASPELVARTRSRLLEETRTFDSTLSLFPIVTPIAAYLAYETIARETRGLIDTIGQRQAWFSADGNAYEIEILAPLINGVVMPAIAIALGTTAATTISTLRERQLAVRGFFNNELCGLESLRAAVKSLRQEDFLVSGTGPARAIELLRDYVARLILESKPGTTAEEVEMRRIADNELVELSALLHAVSQKRQTTVEAAHNLIASLSTHRSNRVAEQAATYPAIHYAVLALCSLSIIASFLLESDQEVLRFLDAIQLRLLFAILVGVFSGIAALIVDLSDLNSGGFRITPTYSQLFEIHDNLQFDTCLIKQDDDAFSSWRDRHLTPPDTLNGRSSSGTATTTTTTGNTTLIVRDTDLSSKPKNNVLF